MADLFKEVVDDVLNGLENCMDRHEDRMLIGGPEWGSETIHKYTLYVDGEMFTIIIEKRSERPLHNPGKELS